METTCKDCPFWNYDEGQCEYPDTPPCEVVGYEVVVTRTPRPRPYIVRRKNGHYFVIDTTQELMNQVANQMLRLYEAKQHIKS